MYRVQKMSQPSSGCKTFIINHPLLGKLKLAKVLELCIVHFSKNCMVEGLCLSQSMSQLKTLLKPDCWCKLPNLPQIRHKKQDLPPAQSRGAVTFSGL